MSDSISFILDIETLSRRPDAVVTDIAVLAVNRKDFTVIDHILLRPGFFEQIELGRHICNETIQFHRKHGTLPMNVGAEPVESAHAQLAAFADKHQPHRVWIHGKDFDIPKLDSLFLHVAKPLPWKYYQVICARDAWTLAFPEDVKRAKRPHDAIEDCKATLDDTLKALTALDRTAWF